MVEKDLILRETQKLALIIAKLMGLKSEGKNDEFSSLIDKTLIDVYHIPFDQLLDVSLKDFEVLLADKNYSAVQLDYLAQFLYLRAEPFTLNPQTLLSLQKTLFIFDLLEQKHHWQSFENINKRRLINQLSLQ